MLGSATYHESHLKVLRLLERDPSMSQRKLANSLGISLGKTNYCVRQLLDRGWIKIQNFRHSKNKCAYAYVLTPAGFLAKTDLTGRFLQIKMREYEVLKAEIELLKRETLKSEVPLATAIN
jgi:EPS-associated MarR family transcriptional regulator